MNFESVRIIERLRKAASEHGEVADLLVCLAASLAFIDDGELSFHGDQEDRLLLSAAIAAAAFVKYDRSPEGNK
jgi:hypothetical protein